MLHVVARTLRVQCWQQDCPQAHAQYPFHFFPSVHRPTTVLTSTCVVCEASLLQQLLHARCTCGGPSFSPPLVSGWVGYSFPQIHDEFHLELQRRALYATWRALGGGTEQSMSWQAVA